VTKPGLILGIAWGVGASGFSRAIKIMLQDKAKRMLRQPLRDAGVVPSWWLVDP
jgi:hypothetical protein